MDSMTLFPDEIAILAAEAARGILPPDPNKRIRPPRNADKERRRKVRAVAKRTKEAAPETEESFATTMKELTRRGAAGFKQAFLSKAVHFRA